MFLRRRKRRARENPSDFVDGGNGYGLSSAGMERTNSNRSMVTSENNDDFDQLEPNDTYYNTECTLKLREDYNTPIDFSSKKSTLNPQSTNANLPYFGPSESLIKLLPLSTQKVVHENASDYANKYSSETLLSKSQKNPNEMLLLNERRFENISTSIQNTINPFSIERLISKQEFTLE